MYKFTGCNRGIVTCDPLTDCVVMLQTDARLVCGVANVDGVGWSIDVLVDKVLWLE